MFLGGQDVGGPVEGVAAVVDGAAGLGRVVHGAEVLPLRGAHLRAVFCGARRVVREEAHYQAVGLLHEEATELVEPERTVHVLGRRGEYCRRFARDGDSGVGVLFGARRIEVERFEVLLELKRRVELVVSVL